MGSLSTVLLVMVGLFVALLVGMNVFVRLRARAMRGRPLPELPGAAGRSIARSANALVYFFSPQCAACRTLTPQIRALAKSNKSVFAVDVTQDLELARALRIMATPSTVEVAHGRVVDVHVGLLPAGVLARYGS